MDLNPRIRESYVVPSTGILPRTLTAPASASITATSLTWNAPLLHWPGPFTDSMAYERCRTQHAAAGDAAFVGAGCAAREASGEGTTPKRRQGGAVRARRRLHRGAGPPPVAARGSRAAQPVMSWRTRAAAGRVAGEWRLVALRSGRSAASRRGARRPPAEGAPHHAYGSG